MEHGSEKRNRSDSKRREKGPAPLLGPETVDWFLDHLKVELGRSPATLIRYRSHLEDFINVVGNRPVVSIDGECLSLYKRQLLDRGLAPATMSSLIGCLRSFLRYLRDVRGISVYDAEKVRRPKVPKREVEFLTAEEVQRFLQAIPTKTLTGVRDRSLAEVLFASGMRISEALALERTSVDWEAKEARIIGKGSRQRRVYFTDDALGWLGEYLQRRRDHHPALFVTHGGEPSRLRSEGSWKRFSRYARLARLSKRVYPHLLRHTMATTLLANGCPIGHIRVLLGHAHLATTCQYYLGRLSDQEAKLAHRRFLTYGRDGGLKTDEKGGGEENGEQRHLTDRVA
jgi:integrase/recombinase XerD